ncbi:2-C-methyl-D-erythritol 4-phosphate cytidylyltransferase [Pleionea sediminis]|uniref:2-C-methyl-D-erythritol 4-phosphate cytidylyltransferase n=1 Tax=Pleionea sediminis TaxID=2569479 RepID=UPI0011849718|nr:2-C-methyl-D-erythritol 4-phosphate cytidylyltransferase [Pleionea sediminis]
MANCESDIWVVIPAAGCGSRMQSDVPKQYLSLANKKVIEHSLDLFSRDESLSGIVVVADADDRYIDSILQNYSDKVVRVEGGKERADSVLNGLLWLNELDSAKNIWVLVHDAARPCLTVGDLDKLKKSRKTFSQGAILVAPVVDTLKQVSGDTIVATHNRAEFRRALTPQLAPLTILLDALINARKANQPITDEAQALEFAGHQVGTVEGERNNLKITYPEDLALAEWILKNREIELK